MLDYTKLKAWEGVDPWPPFDDLPFVTTTEGNPQHSGRFDQGGFGARAGMFRPLDVLGFAHEMWTGQPDEHARILDSIAAGDADAASDAMREHIEGVRHQIHVMI